MALCLKKTKIRPLGDLLATCVGQKEGKITLVVASKIKQVLCEYRSSLSLGTETLKTSDDEALGETSKQRQCQGEKA